MQQPEPKKTWYLPHHPVVNPNKPGKVRRVANAGAKFRGQSLNSNLITGPDLLNNLVEILLRFRENSVAILSDIEGMFMQLAIRPEDQSVLRFLWPNEEMVNQYQFTRLIFGATCSPFCATFVLNRCAQDKEIEFPKVVNAIKNHFYMDDYIHSLPDYSSQLTRLKIAFIKVAFAWKNLCQINLKYWGSLSKKNEMNWKRSIESSVRNGTPELTVF